MKIKLLLCVLFCFLILGQTYAGVRAAKITQYTGEVKSIRGKMVMGVRINLFISEGDIIETGPESEVYLLFKSGSKLRIGENSNFTVTACMENEDGSRDIKSFLKLGSVICNIKKLSGKKNSFKLSTPSATCSIRGTIFETVVAQDGSSTINVLEGVVDVGIPGSDKVVQVPPNKQAKVSKETKEVITTDIPAKEKERLVKKVKKIVQQKKIAPPVKKETKKKEKPTKESEKPKEEAEESKDQTEGEEETSEESEETKEEATTEEEGEQQEETTEDIMDDIIPDDSEPIKNEIPMEEILDKIPSPS